MSRFDGLALAVDQPSRLTLQHPITGRPLADKDGNEAYIDLLPLDSETARKYERKVTNQRLAKRARVNVTAEELEAEQAARLAAVTTGWRFVSFDGEAMDIPFTNQAAVELYGTPEYAWLREQVESFLNNRANFSQASSKN